MCLHIRLENILYLSFFYISCIIFLYSENFENQDWIVLFLYFYGIFLAEV